MKRGITSIDLLQISFINLKLIGIIDWPWWQVLTPFVIVILFGMGARIVAAIAKGKA